MAEFRLLTKAFESAETVQSVPQREDTMISLLFRLWAIRKLWGIIRGNRNRPTGLRRVP